MKGDATFETAPMFREEEEAGPSEEELRAIARAEGIAIVKELVKVYTSTRNWINYYKESLKNKGIQVPTVHLLPKVTEEILLKD